MNHSIHKISAQGRFLFSIPMVIFGLFHFMNAKARAGMVPIPGGVFWIYLTGFALVAAGISISIQKFDDWASLLLAILLIIFAITISLPGVLSGGEMVQMYTTNLLKDMALAGGALLYLNSLNKK
jgi:putative oxidoreductase